MWGQMQIFRLDRWSVSLRNFVIAVMFLALTPLLSHALLSTWHSHVSTRAWAEADLVADAERLARQIDSRLELSHRTMRLLAGSPAALRGDIATLREQAEMALAQGLISAAILRDHQGRAVFAVGMAWDDAADRPQPMSGQFTAETLQQAPALVASLPVRTDEARMARLDVAVAADSLLAAGEEGAGGRWHVVAVADREGRHLWSRDPGAVLPPAAGRRDAALQAGMLPDGAGPEGKLQSSAFAQAPRSGLLVAISQPAPSMLQGVPFGPGGTAWIAVAMVLASLGLAAAGAAAIHRAYRGAATGARSGPIPIEDAARLGADLRLRRDRLFQAMGGIAVAELTRPPGRTWRDATVVASPNLRTLLAWPKDRPLTLDSVIESLAEDDRKSLEALVTSAGAEAVAFSLVVQMTIGDRIRHVSLVGMMREAIPGLDDQLILTLQDVTPQRELERELQTQAARLGVATEIAGLGLWERDLRGNVGRANDHLWRILGRAPGGAIEVEEYLRLVHPEDREQVAHLFATARPGEIGPESMPAAPAPAVRYRIVRPDGEIRHVHLRRRFVTDSAGVPDRVVAVLADETEAVLARQALEASESRLRLAVEAAALGVFEYDPIREVGHWSDRMWRLRGREPRATAPSLPEAAAMVHPEDRDWVVPKTHSMWAQRDGNPSEAVHRVLWPDGTVRHIMSRAITRHDSDGRLLHVFGINLDVTESRRAAEAVKESETRLRLASEAADLGIWDIDLVAGRRTISPRMWRMFGLEPREGAPERSELLAVVLPADHGILHKAWAEIAAGEDVIDYEYRVRLPDGEIRHLHGQGRTMRDADGRPLRITGISADVTEARRATQALADSEARMRLAVDAADIGVFEFHSRDGTGYWSERNWRMRGLQPHEGIPTFDEAENLVHPEDRASATRARHKQLGNPDGGITEHEYRLVWTDGTVRYVLSRSITRRSPDGTLLKVVGINIDVTARRMADQLIMRSEARFRLAIETAQLGVWDYDPATGGSVWSARMCEIRGLPAKDSPITLAEILATTHPDDRARMAAQVQAQRDGLRPGATETEYRVIRPDGTVRLVLSRSVAIHDAAGRLLQVLGVNQDITDQRAAEAALQEKEATFRLATETASLGIYRINLPEFTGAWSERMYTMRGLPPRPGRPTMREAMAAVHPDDRDMLHARMASYATSASGEVSQYEFRVVWPDGTVRHILARAFTEHDDAGALRKIIGVNQDITEQKRAEQELRDSAARFQLATKAAGLAVWEWQVPDGTRHWSPEMWALRGLPPRETPPSDAEVIATVYPEDRIQAAAFIEGLRTNPGEQAEGEYRVVRPDGSIRHLSLRAVALRDAAGRVVRITGIASDITERVLATRALQESESFFRLATEAASQGVWDRDTRTGQVRWSHRMWAICGLPEQATPPTREEWEALLHPDDRAEVMAMLAKLRTRPDDSADQMAFRIRTPEGAIRHLDMRAMSVHDADGVLPRIIGVVVDVTEAQELRAQAAIAGNVATLGQLAGGIAHELAQPLQAMIAAADTAALKLRQSDDPETREDAREKLARISTLAARAGRTIRHLLAFSRGTSTSGAAALPDAVAGALELVGQNLRQADVDVAVALPADLPMVVGGLIEIEQVLVNLLLNARDALEDRPLRRVDIRAARHGDSIELTVADTGPGIPAQVVSRIFDPFFTTKPAGKGTGLGLAISQKTMQAIGGTIAVRTGSDGTAFTLAFQPLEEPDPAAAG